MVLGHRQRRSLAPTEMHDRLRLSGSCPARVAASGSDLVPERYKFYGYRHGLGVRILRGVITHHPLKLTIGDNSGISSGTQINAAAGIAIGKGVLIGPNCIIWSQNHRYQSLDKEIRGQGYEYSPVNIEDDVWIAASCVILPGVTLGKGFIFAAGAVATKPLPPGVIAAGVPARVIGRRDGLTPPQL